MNPHKITPFAESILPRYFVALDLETTGLMANRDRIVEIAALKFDIRSNNHQAFSVLIKQDEPIPSSATEVHGITDAMCAASGVSLGDDILGLYDFIGINRCESNCIV
jgi:DNA polymerase III epsilon subunit-like protein